VPVVYIASGETFPDALSGAAAAAAQGGPVLLVTKSSIPSETDRELRRLLPQRIVVLGGTNAVSSSVEQSLALYTLPTRVSRLAGPDRYATSVAVSKAMFTGTAPRVYLATGRSFADALAGGPVAAAGGGPLLLVPGTCLPAVVRAEIDRLKPSQLVLLGGSSAVTGALGSLQPC
jgi:putative cell wall-binding protein